MISISEKNKIKEIAASETMIALEDASNNLMETNPSLFNECFVIDLSQGSIIE